MAAGEFGGFRVCRAGFLGSFGAFSKFRGGLGLGFRAQGIECLSGLGFGGFLGWVLGRAARIRKQRPTSARKSQGPGSNTTAAVKGCKNEKVIIQ